MGDGGVRQKKQRAEFFCERTIPFCSIDFDNGFAATLTQFSVTPRLTNQHGFFGMPGKLITGIDFYDTLYDSDRSRELRSPHLRPPGNGGASGVSAFRRPWLLHTTRRDKRSTRCGI